MANTTIRETARKKRIAQWEIAEALGLNESVFSRMMRHELPADKQERILTIIEELSKKET